jgi:hypothetical protein
MSLHFRRPLLAIVLVALFAGCATLFRSSLPTVEIIGADSLTTIQSQRGSSVRTFYEDGHLYAEPQEKFDDTLIIRKKGATARVALAKRMSAWLLLDLLSYGPGFFIDDLGHRWYNYEPVYVRSMNEQDSIRLEATSTNWLGEPAGRKRPELLITGGLGISGAVHPIADGEAGALLGPANFFPTFYIAFEGGVGIDLYKKLELFYFGHDLPGYPITARANLWDATAEMSSSNMAARYFVYKNWYAQVSYGRAYASIDSFPSSGPDSNNIISSYSKPFPLVGVAIGWSGDFSYAALEYVTGTRDFTIQQYGPLPYRIMTLTFGLNLRF